MTPLRKRMIKDMTVRGLAENTRKSYLNSVSGLARHYGRSPERISAQEVQDYLIFLHDERGLTWQSCNCARHGISFFYRITLGLPEQHFYVPGAKTPSILPELLNHDELVRLFSVTTNRKHRAVLMTAYAAGLRASELGRLRIRDIDSQRMCLRVDQGKGNKDRYGSALAPAAGGAARRTGAGSAPSTGCSPVSYNQADVARLRAGHIYRSQGEGRDRQARRHPHAASLLCHQPPRGRGRAARHSAPPRAQLHPLDHALPASGPRQDERHPVSPGPAGVPASRPDLTGGPCRPRGAGRAAGAGGRGHPARVRRCL